MASKIEAFYAKYGNIITEDALQFAADALVATRGEGETDDQIIAGVEKAIQGKFPLAFQPLIDLVWDRIAPDVKPYVDNAIATFESGNVQGFVVPTDQNAGEAVAA